MCENREARIRQSRKDGVMKRETAWASLGGVVNSVSQKAQSLASKCERFTRFNQALESYKREKDGEEKDNADDDDDSRKEPQAMKSRCSSSIYNGLG